MEIYETIVKAIGKEAALFKSENMLILFGLEAPADLRDYCYNIEVQPVSQEIQPGMVLKIGEQSYQITAVGNVVRKNLSELGHITIKFDGATVADLPGTLHVESKDYPGIDLETIITIK